MASLLRTENKATGQRRYYVDGRRVSRDAYDAAYDAARRLDCLHTTNKGGTIRHYCEARD